ncbi:hypothetical protein G9A89_013378 [Geosiphon pyriformis]|nr:hypothetical protein G9A89_013378 [Geosiphon pyriformis]
MFVYAVVGSVSFVVVKKPYILYERDSIITTVNNEITDAQFHTMDTPRAPNQDAIDVFDAVKQDVINRLKELRHDDIVYEIDGIPRIKAYNLVLFAREEADYGWHYFGKIQVAEGKYVHAR